MNQYSAEDMPVDNTLNYTVIRFFSGKREAKDVVSDLMKVHVTVDV